MSSSYTAGRHFVAKVTSIRVIAWAGMTFFLFCAVMSWRAGQGEVAPLFLAFVGLGVFLLVFCGPV